jgi:nitrogen regulatory protein PII
MKLIRAYIKPHKLADVTLALHIVERLTGVSVSSIRGFGRGRGKKDEGSAAEEVGDFLPGVLIEVYCKSETAEDIVFALENTAYTGLRGDGKVYVLPVEHSVKISTGERGDEAV